MVSGQVLLLFLKLNPILRERKREHPIPFQIQKYTSNLLKMGEQNVLGQALFQFIRGKHFKGRVLICSVSGQHGYITSKTVTGLMHKLPSIVLGEVVFPDWAVSLG